MSLFAWYLPLLFKLKTEVSVIKISKYLDSEYSILQRHVILLGVAER